jgi:hypothetical protein
MNFMIVSCVVVHLVVGLISSSNAFPLGISQDLE